LLQDLRNEVAVAHVNDVRGCAVGHRGCPSGWNRSVVARVILSAAARLPVAVSLRETEEPLAERDDHEGCRSRGRLAPPDGLPHAERVGHHGVSPRISVLGINFCRNASYHRGNPSSQTALQPGTAVGGSSPPPPPRRGPARQFPAGWAQLSPLSGLDFP